jgi:sucrose-6-phosphate hydrolase SacC (GH32 family)
MPKDADGNDAGIRHWDPDCWLNNGIYYALSGGQNPHLMKSPDLKNWTYLGLLLHDEYPVDLGVAKGEDISCANMFKIGRKWMLLCISHRLGCRYYLGDFKDEKYLPHFHAMMSWNGNHYFAPESVLTPDGRRVMWAWQLHRSIAPSGVQALPRELELRGDGILRMRPLRELQALRHDEKRERNITLRAGKPRKIESIAGDAFELELQFNRPVAAEFGVDVLCNENGANGLRVAVVREAGVLRVGGVNAPFELRKGEDLTLRIFVDKNFVEVFAADRQAAATAAGPYNPTHVYARLFAEGGNVKVLSAISWKMKSIYEGNTVFK